MSEAPRKIRSTKGRRLFREWLSRENGGRLWGGQSGMAERLEVHANLIHRWLDGNRRPSLDMAAELERVTEGAVPAVAWTQDEDEAAKAAG